MTIKLVRAVAANDDTRPRNGLNGHNGPKKIETIKTYKTIKIVAANVDTRPRNGLNGLNGPNGLKNF